MRFIAHRGNTAGPVPEMENRPEYIAQALAKGFGVEVDVWLLSNELWLGHDRPTYKTDRYFLQNKLIWTHCKNNAAFLELYKYPDINCFFQQDDDLAPTSRGYIWAHSRCSEWNDRTVVVNLSNNEDEKAAYKTDRPPYAICSDYLSSAIPADRTYPFELLIVDIDGVMTNGTKLYDLDGKIYGKQYCDLDFTAIKRFWAAGIKVCFLSGDKTVNKAMAESRKIDFFHNPPGVDKVDMLDALKKHYSTSKVAYVGDDYYDIAIMSSVSLSMCPQTSPAPVKRAAKFIIPVDAGRGVLAGIYDLFENEIPFAFPRDSADVNPK